MLQIGPKSMFERVELLGSKIDDEFVFFDQQAGCYYAIGSVGADVWEILESSKSFSEICDELEKIYEVDRATCETQLRHFLIQLLEAGLIREAALPAA